MIVAQALLLSLALAVPAQPGKHSIDELVFLMGFGSLGDAGSLDTSRDVLSPSNRLGFSLKCSMDTHPGGPGYWSIRSGLPERAGAYDTLSFDLYVESTDDKSSLTVYLYEPDEDRFVCSRTVLKDVEKGKWRHFDIPKRAMDLWLLGDGKAEWEKVSGIAFECGGGKATFYLDGVTMTGMSGKGMQVFNVADDGYAAIARDWHEPVHSPDKPGTVFFPFDGGRLASDEVRERIVKLKDLLGPVGGPIAGVSSDLVDTIHYRESRGVPNVYYSQFAQGYMRYITRRQGWDVGGDGRSPNWLTKSETPTWDTEHAICFAHPAVNAALREKVDALIAAGLGTWMVVDYVFPWWETLWGYADAYVPAFRDDLAGRDEGLFTRDGGQRTIVHFADYFRAYNGFVPKPGDLGLTSWDAYSPPKPGGDQTDLGKRCMATFFYLRSYEWLKLADRTGRYMKSKGGQGLWLMPNPEDTMNGGDYAFAVRSEGVGNIFPEYFGAIGFEAEAGYASLPYLREEADRGGSRSSIVQETGAGGHSSPYLDWRIAYAGVYSLTASGRFDDFDNDFLDEATYEDMSDPGKNAYQFKRFRDGTAKAMAFLQARQEKPARPGQAQILAISERPPAMAAGTIFMTLGEPHSFATGLSRAHLLFDLRGSLDLDRALARGYKMVAYAPWAPRVGDLALLRKWLDGAPGRVLVTHSFVPTRRTDGWWQRDDSARLGGRDDAGILGLGAITSTAVRECKVTAVASAWSQFMKPGQALKFSAPLVNCPGGEVLVMGDHGPLVTRHTVGKSQVVFLHFTPGDGPEASRFDADVMRAIAAESGVQPTCDADFDAVVQVFNVGVGRAVVAFDAPATSRWSWSYTPGIAPMPFAAPDVKRTIKLRADSAGPWMVYDFWADKLQVLATVDGWIELPMTGTNTSLFYVALDTEALAPCIVGAHALRQRMKALHFDDVGM